MDSLDPESPVVAEPPVTSGPRVWKFWGTTFWGFVVFAAMFVGQLAVVGWFLFRQGGSIDQESFTDAVTAVVSNGKTISLSEVEGDVTLVTLWGTWCAPCRREIPRLRELLRKHGGRGLKIVGINFEREADADPRRLRIWSKAKPPD